MKIIYRAENIFDASLIKGLLESEGIQAFVAGGYLQGGVGELPASGLVQVSVADDDVEAARTVVDRYERDTRQATNEDKTHQDPSDELLDWL